MSRALESATRAVASTTQTNNTAVSRTYPAASSSATFAAVEDPVLPLPTATVAAEVLAAWPCARVRVATPLPKIDPADHGLVKMNACALTLAEFRAMSGVKGMLHGAVVKLLRQRNLAITDLPTVTDIAPFRVETHAIPAEGKEKLATLAGAFRESGYQEPLWYELVDTFNSAAYYFGVMPHASGESFALISFRVWSVVHPKQVTWSAQVCSALEDGGFASTLNDDFILGAPATYRTCLAGRSADPKKLIAEHAALLKRVGTPVRKLTSHESVRAAAEAWHAGQARLYLERGIFKPLTDDERALAKSARIDGDHAMHSDVLMEIQRQHGKQRAGTGTLSKAVLLVVSLGLFMYAQKASATWQYVAMLAGVIFFHELGHFVAMKAFGYRDVKMFFVPFCGAAVTGRKVSVAVWKRALVALAGPVPGVLLGIVFGAIALISPNPAYGQLANLLLVVNLANLLPILPLDGGQFMETVLFSRSPALSVFFRCLGVAGLVGLYCFTHGGFFLALAIIFGLTLPLEYSVSKVAEQLRKEGKVQPDVDQNIPPQTAGLIASRLRAALPTGNNRKTVAVYATQVYERVAMPHASRLASVGLLALYLSAIVAGGSFGSVLYTASQGRLCNVGQWGDSHSEHAVDAGKLQAWDGSASCAQRPHITIVAPFSKPADALKSFEALKNEAPATAAVRLFGDTVFMLLPAGDNAARSEWFARLDAKTKGVFVLREGERCTAHVQFTALDAERAKQIEEDLNVYFALTQFNVAAPWVEDQRDETTRARIHAAQLTYYTASHVDTKEYDNGEFHKKVAEAQRRGEEAEVKRLYDEQAASYICARDQKRAELRRQPWVRTDVLDVITANEALADKRAKNKSGAEVDYEAEHLAHREKLAPLLGGTAEDAAGPAAASFNAWGLVTHDGVDFELQCLNFDDIATGAPALVKWLSSRGTSINCTIVRTAMPTITDVRR